MKKLPKKLYFAIPVLAVLIVGLLSFPDFVRRVEIATLEASDHNEVEDLHAVDSELAALAVKKFKWDLGWKRRLKGLTKATIQSPLEYIAERQLITKLKDSIESNKESNAEMQRYWALSFFLRNGDVEYAKQLLASLETEKVRASGNSLFALFYAQNGQCQIAMDYNKKLEEVFALNDWVIRRGKSFRNVLRVKSAIENWSESTLLCDNYVSAFELYEKYDPVKIAYVKGLVDVYRNYALTLNDAGQKDEARRFLKLVGALLKDERTKEPRAIYFNQIFGHLAVGDLEKAYDLYKKLKRSYPEHLAYYLNQLLVNELAINGEIKKAIGLMEDRVTPVLLIEAKAQLPKAEYYKFLLEAKLALEKSATREGVVDGDAMHWPYYSEVFVALYELGDKSEADEMIKVAKISDQKTIRDIRYKRSFMAHFLPALVRVGEINEALPLLQASTSGPGPVWLDGTKPPLPWISSYSEAYGALYIHYDLAGQMEKKEEIDRGIINRGSFFYNAVVPYFMKVGDFEMAEQYVGQSRDAHRLYMKLYEAKIGKTAAHSAHENSFRSLYRGHRGRFRN